MIKIKTKNAFTLIELLIVIAIIGILASAVLVNTNSARLKARTAKSVLELQSVNTSLQSYQALYGSYPVSSDSGNNWDGYCSFYGASLGVNWIPLLATVGLSNGSLPIEPRNNGACWDDKRQYLYRSNGTDYKLISHWSESMSVPDNLIDPVRDTYSWGWWSSSVSAGW
ncbi:MAG: hypothetical protein ACD_5C00327G0002 [uncultured bacterium]|nr:MAG: hypothetical protein ACD_5C00327G0002 [uncultured bacterium]